MATVRIRAIAGDDSAFAYNSELVTPEESLRVRNHSPSGFAWGYMGSGPAQMSLAILLRHTGDRELAETYYQDFKQEVVGTWPTTKNVDVSLDIDDWIRRKKEEESTRE